MRDALRLAFGTLTVLPVGAPRLVDRRVGGWAMVLAPVVGLVLGLVVGGVARLVAERSTLVAGGVAVALVAVLTRAIHLDGLADTADGLGSGRPPADALAVMRRSDIGPFGVVALVLALLLQVASTSTLLARGDGFVALVTALVVSRTALPLTCSVGVPAARADGLGTAVAGTVSRGQSLLAVALAAIPVAAVVLLDPPAQWWGLPLAAAAGLLATGVLTLRCVRRLGGVTGDVLGAAVEVACTTVLVVSALAG